MSSPMPAPPAPAPALALTALFWCRSCGSDATPGEEHCRWCGVSLVGPDPGPPRVGQAVAIPGRLLTKIALAVEEQPGTVVALVKAGETVALPTEQFDALRRVEVSGPPVVGATGRLWTVNRARFTGTMKGNWPGETVDAAAAAYAMENLAGRRAAALDAIALGIPEWPEQLELTATEVVWYRARAAGVGPDPAAVLDWLERLPQRGYLARIPLLLRHVAGLLQNPALHERARAALAPFVETSPGRRALSLALQATPVPDIVAATLVARERWDHQNRGTILAHERQLLDRLDVHIDRCSRYLKLLDNLPLDDATLEMRGKMTANAHGWTAESRRLRGLL